MPCHGRSLPRLVFLQSNSFKKSAPAAASLEALHRAAVALDFGLISRRHNMDATAQWHEFSVSALCRQGRLDEHPIPNSKSIARIGPVKFGSGTGVAVKPYSVDPATYSPTSSPLS